MSEGDAPDQPPQRVLRPDRRRAYRLARAANAALGVPPQDVAVELIALERGARVVDADLTGVDAMLVRAGAKAEILVARRLPPRARRFTVLHELGHLELHAHRSLLGLCTGDLSKAAYSAEPLEQEASAYGSERLMPRDAFLALAGDAEPSWEVVKELGEAFDASLTAAALRFVSLHSRRVAFVLLRDDTIVWSARSWRWKAELRPGMRAPLRSTVIGAPGRWPATRVAVPARVWIADAPDGASVLEHAFRTPLTGMVMALLELLDEAGVGRAG